MNKYSITSLRNYASYIYKKSSKPKSLQPAKSDDSCPFHDDLFLQPHIKTITNKRNELQFHKSFLKKTNITKYVNVFENYARRFVVEMFNPKYPLTQLITKPHAKNLLKDLLGEIKRFKFQISLKVTVCRAIKNLFQF